jgi:hypothetical protein
VIAKKRAPITVRMCGLQDAAVFAALRFQPEVTGRSFPNQSSIP